MVVVDSSALIPLAQVGHLDLITASSDEVRTIEAVRDEVLIEGKRGTANLQAFLEAIPVHRTPSDAEPMAELEGIALADAAVILVAKEHATPLLANDRGLVEVAQSQSVACWWVTTLLLKAADEGVLTSTEAGGVLLALVDDGMYLHPRVYARVLKALRDLGD
jgi:predicted nucleic acid-binding protein